jgi:cephalosporin hydroxylase
MDPHARISHVRLRIRRALLPVLHRRRRREDITDRFHELYFDAHLEGKTWADTRWLGHPVAKCPLDLWVYQEIVQETRPDLVVETGTFAGRSALFFASLFDLAGNGRIVTVDVEPVEGRPSHDRITYLTGSSTALEIVEEMRRHVDGAERVLVVLDSDYRREHVLAELHAYADFVTRGATSSSRTRT